MSAEDKNQPMLPVPYKKGVGLLYASLPPGIYKRWSTMVPQYMEKQ